MSQNRRLQRLETLTAAKADALNFIFITHHEAGNEDAPRPKGEISKALVSSKPGPRNDLDILRVVPETTQPLARHR